MRRPPYRAKSGRDKGGAAPAKSRNRKGGPAPIILVTHEHDIAEHAHRVIHIRDGKVESDERRS